MFESIESTLYPIVCDINTYLSNYILVFLLLGVGLWYSIKTRFVQLRSPPPLPLRSARATSSALPVPSSPAAPAPSSGCG